MTHSILRRWLPPAAIVASVALVIALLPPTFARHNDAPTGGHEATVGPTS